MRKRNRNVILGEEEPTIVEPSNTEENIETPTTEEDPVVDPSDDEEEDEEVISTGEKIKTRGYIYPGYDPSRGKESSWYEPEKEVRPRVYHKYAKEDVYQTLYPDLINKDEDEEEPVVDPETPVVEPTNPETPTVDPETPVVEPSDPETPTVDPETPVVEPTDPETPTTDPVVTDPEDPGDPGEVIP